MKLAILGTRGVPNNYGGFERAAEEVAVRLVQMGHDVTVYNPDDHPCAGDFWRGIRIKRMFCREGRLGIFGTFLFDYFCSKILEVCIQYFVVFYLFDT